MRVRKIVHIDMDAFYASVEQRDDPQLRGKPVVVAWRGNRSVVCVASYEARRFGVRSAMPAVRAERLCPNAVFLPPDFPRYRAVSRQVHEIFRLHTDLIEPLSLDEAYLDVSENKTSLPTATQVARMIREQIKRELTLTASAGVAPNKFLAKIASDWRKPDGLFVIQPGAIDSFLLPLPVSRLPGVGKVTEEKLKSLAAQTVADLRKLELAALERQLFRSNMKLSSPTVLLVTSFFSATAADSKGPRTSDFPPSMPNDFMRVQVDSTFCNCLPFFICRWFARVRPRDALLLKERRLSGCYELARGVDKSEVVPDRPTKSVSAEDTFEHDVPLSQIEPMIRRLAEKTWTALAHRRSRGREQRFRTDARKRHRRPICMPAISPLRAMR
jgi:nucleotidyltransferase/DNA polymerase involved in DNA repair